MTKRFVLFSFLIAVLVLISLTPLVGQTSAYTFQQSTTFTSASPGRSVYNIGTGTAYHYVVFNITGTVSACSFTVDSSPDNVTWTVGGIIAATTCTANGVTAITPGVANWTRVNVSTFTGTGSVTTLYSGYATSTSAQYMAVTTTAAQTTGLTAGSAVVFTKVVTSLGADISLNTSTGVFTLAAGHTYELRGAVPSVVTGNSGNQVAFQWYNITTSSYIGSGQGIYSPTSSGYNMAGGIPIADITTTVTTTVKLNLAFASQAISSIGNNVDFSGVTMYPYATVRELW